MRDGGRGRREILSKMWKSRQTATAYVRALLRDRITFYLSAFWVKCPEWTRRDGFVCSCKSLVVSELVLSDIPLRLCFQTDLVVGVQQHLLGPPRHDTSIVSQMFWVRGIV